MTTIDFEKLFKDGFKTWKNNLILFVPFILSVILILLILGIVAIVSFLPLFLDLIQNPESINYSVIISQILSPITIISFIIGIVGIIFVGSFFLAGAIGMAKEALITGKTHTTHMIEYGKKKFLSIIGANLLIAALILIGVIFLLPGILGGVFSPEKSFLYFIPGIIVMISYMLIVSLLVALVNYAIVIDDFTAIQGFKKGIKTVWYNNKINVFIVWLIIIAFSLLIGLLSLIPFIGWLLMYTVMILVYYPLTTVWWSKLYLTITQPSSPEQASEDTIYDSITDDELQKIDEL